MTAVVEVQGPTLSPGYEPTLEVGCEVEVVGSHQTLQGIYLGEVYGSRLVFDQTVGVMSLGDVLRVVVRRAAPVDTGELLLIRALAAEATSRHKMGADHAVRIDEIVLVAHEAADDRDWCEDFDDILSSLQLPRREREYSVRASYSGSVVVSVTATSEDEALAVVDLRRVRDELESDGWPHLALDLDGTDVD